MELVTVEKEIIGNMVRLTGLVRSREGEKDVFFEYPEQFAPMVIESADPFVAALLLTAMTNSETLEILPPVSQRLWGNLPRIQEIFNCWYPETLKKIQIRADRFHETRAEGNGVGSFFSLGVDSFHTLLCHEEDVPGRERISHLIYMMGFEVPLSEFTDGRERSVMDHVHEAARIWNKEAICGRTNIRDCFPLNWSRQYHGSALVATALSLGGGLHKALIPSSATWSNLMPWGSHPVIDPLWSSENMEIIHDGANADRVTKIMDTIALYPEALRLLRVCVNKRGGSGNCGFCVKCIRTMTALEMAGVLRSCGSFPPKLPRDFWRRMELKAFSLDATLRIARKKNAPVWIIDGLERALALGRINELRKARGYRRFSTDLFRYALEKTAGRLFLLPNEIRRRRIRPRKPTVKPVAE